MAIHDRHTESRVRTNPVLSIRQTVQNISTDPMTWMTQASGIERVVNSLRQEGIELPAYFVKELAANGIQANRPQNTLTPGVVALLVDESSDIGLTSSIHVELLDTGRESNWEINENLPVTRNDLFTIFRSLSDALELPPTVPERLCFSLNYELDEPARGRSMDVAALLAILRTLYIQKAGDAPKILNAACAVVQPDSDRQLLCATAGIQQKLTAFVREYERGTLLIRQKNCAYAAYFDQYFEEVWAVDSFTELAKRLHEHDLIQPLLQTVVLQTNDLARLNHQLHQYIEGDRDHQAAEELACRIKACEIGPDVPKKYLFQLHRHHYDARRHLGSLDVLIDEEILHQALTESDDFTSYEELFESAVNYGASFYDPHLFELTLEFLQPWLERVNQDPRLVNATIRYMLFNTYARTLVVLQKPGWEELFHRSIRLQEALEPNAVQRTRNYLIHGYLRTAQLESAQAEISLALQDPYLNDESRRFLIFYQADLARQKGEQWTEPEFEILTSPDSKPHYCVGFYFQATARQQGRTPDDVIARFRHAQHHFYSNPDRLPGILTFLALVSKLAQSSFQSTPQWEQTCREIQAVLQTRTFEKIRRYYQPIIDELEDKPDPHLAEKLLQHVPYF